MPILRCGLLVPMMLAAAGCATAGVDAQQPLRSAADTQEPGVFSLASYDAPRSRAWLLCAGGRGESDSRVLGPAGGVIALPDGHILTITPGAIDTWLPFLFADPPSDGVVVAAMAPPAPPFAGAGAIITISWANRPGCEVPDTAVIVQLRTGQAPLELRSRVDQRTKTIQTIEPVLGFSLFAIAR